MDYPRPRHGPQLATDLGLGWINVYDTPPVSYGGLLTAGGDRKPSFYAIAL